MKLETILYSAIKKNNKAVPLFDILLELKAAESKVYNIIVAGQLAIENKEEISRLSIEYDAAYSHFQALKERLRPELTRLNLLNVLTVTV